MTFQERARAVANFGFSERQACFLVHVLTHSGVCLQRQYRSFASLVHGQATREFFHYLVAHKFAAPYTHGNRRGTIYHVRHKALYRAIGEPDNRFRRSAFIGRAIERLMLLDAVISAPRLIWLGTESDKLAHFLGLLGTRLRREEFPHVTFGEGASVTVRFFPDKLPIGHDADGRRHVFVFLATHPLPIEFRSFLMRHAELFRALGTWTVRLLLPRHLAPSGARYRAAVRDELATPLSAPTLEELRWYFRQRQALVASGAVADARYLRAQRAFAAARYRALYRAWERTGDAVLEATRSPILADALARGTGAIETQILPHHYDHLLPLVGTA
jgi:hypothetical protein